MPDAGSGAHGVYKPRRPQASPLFRLVSDHLHRLLTVYDDRFARIRCDDCAHEYLLAFSCKCRYFCPNCHAKGLAMWTQWLDTTLLAPVPHRQVVLTIPKRRSPPSPRASLGRGTARAARASAEARSPVLARQRAGTYAPATTIETPIDATRRRAA